MRLRKSDPKPQNAKRRPKKSEEASTSESYAPVSSLNLDQKYVNEKYPKHDLRVGQEPFSFLLESSGVGTWDWDLRSKTLTWSDRCQEMFGVPRGTAMSYERFLKAVHPEDRDRVDAAVKRSLAAKTDYSLEMRSIWADGSVHWITSRGRPYFDASGEAVRMSGAVLDVTHIKQAEDELQQARAEAKADADNLAAVIDAVPALTFFTSDRECRTMSAGRQARGIFGLPEKANVSMSAPEGRQLGFSWLEDGRELTPQELPVQQAAATGYEVRNKKLEVRFPDGRTMNVFGHAVPLVDGSGAVQGAVAALLDITALQKVEEELQRAQAEAKAQADNLRAVFDAMPAAAFFSSDRTGQTMISNRMAHELLRVPIGKSTSLSAPEGERPHHKVFEKGRELSAEELPVQMAARTGQPVRGKELEVRFEDGSSVYIFGHAVPLFDERGEVRGAVGAFLDVSDRRVIEQRLRLANERFLLALRNMPITVFNQGLDLGYKWIYNPGEGYSALDIIGKRDTELLERAEDAIKLESIKNEVIRSGKVFQGEVEIYRQDKLRIYHFTIEPQRDTENRICGLTGASFELTEQRKKEADLAKFARDRQVALDAAKMGWWQYDFAEQRGKWDDTFKSIFGIKENSLPVAEILKYIHPDDRERMSSGFNADFSASEPKTHFGEYRIVRADGSIRWVEMYAAAEFVSKGGGWMFASCAGTVRDISDRKEIAEALRLTNERFEIALKGTPMTVFNQDTDLRITWIYNPVGPHTAAEIIGKRDSELLENKEEAAQGEAIKREVMRTGKSYQGEYVATLNGERRYYHVNIEPRRDAQGEIVGLTCASFDVSALRESEARYRELAANLDREVQQRTRELQRRNEQILRTSEAVRMLNTRLLQSQEQERRRIARELHDSSGQILTAIGLDLANIAEKVRAPGIREIAPDLLQHVEETETLVQKLHRELRTTSYLLHPPLLEEAGLSSAVAWYVQGVAQRSGLEIDVAISSDFGRLSRDLELTLFRVIQESLTNILRHSGSKRASIRISRSQDEITLEIQDQGKGIAAEKLAEIQGGMSGLGIRAMRERLHPFNGELRLESGDGGTRVVVTIPAEHSGERVESGIEPAQAVK